MGRFSISLSPRTCLRGEIWPGCQHEACRRHELLSDNVLRCLTLKIDWNQIHLCELDADTFRGFGREFEAALRDDAPHSAASSDVFAGLDRMRTVPRWTFNDPVVEADAAVAKEGRVEK